MIEMISGELIKLPPEIQPAVAKIVSARTVNDYREVKSLIGEVGAALLKATATPTPPPEDRFKVIAKLKDVAAGVERR